MDSKLQLQAPAPGDEACTIEPYASLVGGLMFLANWMRPDITQAVHVLARFMADPSCSHWLAVKRVLRYLAGTVEWGLLFGGRSEREAGSFVSRVIGWCDADYAGCIDSRKSTSGRVFVLNGAAVSWASRKQSTVSTSTTEAEFIAAADACKEALRLRNLVRDFDRHQDTVDIFSDSTCALALIRNPVHH
jgi:hypothetical protein